MDLFIYCCDIKSVGKVLDLCIKCHEFNYRSDKTYKLNVHIIRTSYSSIIILSIYVCQ